MGTSIQDPSLGGLPSGVDQTEAGYLDGVTSALQTQLDGKAGISGSPAANQLAVFASGSAVGGATGRYHALSYTNPGGFSAGTKIVTAIPATATGKYVFVIHGTQEAGSNQISAVLTVRIAGSAISGTPALTTFGNATFSATTVSIEGGFLCITIGTTTQFHLWVEVLTTVSGAYYTGWTVVDAAAVGGTGCTRLNSMSAMACSTIDHSGAVTMSGSPASAGSTVRNIHGNGGTTDIVANVATGGTHRKSINGTDVMTVNSSGINTTGDLIFSASKSVRAGTSDGSDTLSIGLAGGGAYGNTRGGSVACFGNEHVSGTGKVSIEAGNVTGAKIDNITGGTSRFAINHDGSATLDSTFAASLATALGVGFVGCSLAYSTTQQIGTSFTELSIDTENADPNGMHTSTNTYATVQTGQGGTWEIEAIVVASLIPGTDTHGSDNRHIPEIEIYKNGSTSLRTSRGGILSPGTFVGTNPAECLTVGIITSLAAGDTIRIRARESLSSGANYKFQLIELKMKRLGA